MKALRLYFLGAGGMGMAPLAQYLTDQGHTIFGWDDFCSEERKRQLAFIHWQPTVPEPCDGCVYSAAIHATHPLLQTATSRCWCESRGNFVARTLKGQRLCVICGSHGKSTTTAYLIHFFKRHRLPVNYISGADFQDDAYAVGCGKYRDVWTLLELDESDGTMDGFSPDVAVVLNTDWDHPRHYATAEAYKKAFDALALRTRKCIMSNERFTSLKVPQHSIEPTTTFVGFDVSAARTAFYDLTGETVTEADVLSFPGVKRRQEVLLQTQRLKIISDYAHHPSELQGLLQCLRSENVSLSIAFEPHRASRLQCFFNQFVEQLKRCLHVYLHPLYEAFEGCDHHVRALQAALPDARSLDQLCPEDWVQLPKASLLAFVGAGKIDAFARQWVVRWTRAVVDFFTNHAVTLRANVDLGVTSPFGMGGPVLFVCEPKTLQELQTLLRLCQTCGLPVTPVGSGSNLLIPEKRYDGVVVKLTQPIWSTMDPIFPLDKNNADHAYYNVGAGCLLADFLDQMEAKGIEGFSFLEGIPGTIGGALSMNAGTYDQGICRCVEKLVWMDRAGELHETTQQDLRYGYRQCETLCDGIAIAAVFKGLRSTQPIVRQQRAFLQKQRAMSQPKGKTLGCFFKNPPGESAGKLLDRSGLKGLQVGNFFVSTQHANFIVHKGQGRFRDLLQLVTTMQQTVYRQTGIWLEPEVRILGGQWETYYKQFAS